MTTKIPKFMLKQMVRHKAYNFMEYSVYANEYPPILRLLFWRYRFLITDPQLIGQVLAENHSKVTAQQSTSIKRMNTITSTFNYDDWQTNQLPPLCQPGSNSAGEREQLEAMEHVLSPYIDRWQKYARHQAVLNANYEIQQMLLQFVYEAQGIDFRSHATGLQYNYHKIRQNALPAITQNLLLPKRRNLFFHFSKFKLHRLLQKCWRQSRPADHVLRAYANSNNSKCPLVYLKRILAYQFELTANALTWAIHMLSEYPDWQQYLAHESNELFAHRKQPSELSYTDALLKETLRLFPPWWLITRRTNEPIELAGYHIPARSHLYVSLYGMHRNIYYWIQPRKFNPSRFLKSQPIEPYTYLPFGTTQSGCPLRQQAWQQMKYVLICLVHHFEFHALDYHQYRFDGFYGLSVNPGYKIKISDRS